MSKVLIVVDRMDSGLGIAANSRASVNSEYSVIAALDYISPAKLLRDVLDRESDIVIFSWRYLLLEFTSLLTCKKLLRQVYSESAVGVLIPDYQGISESMLLNSREVELLNLVNFFCVTNLHLQDLYTNAGFSEKLAGVLHDLPDLDLIDLVRAEGRNRNDDQIIWVGNSKWGSRSGHVDYKGFRKIVEPIKLELEARKSNRTLKVIDSSVMKLTNIEVLREISESKCLILASEQEGTGLPILEALALETYVISTNVGVAPELLPDIPGCKIVNRNVSEFLQAIDELPVIGLEFDGSSLLDKYLLQVKSEDISRGFRDTDVQRPSPSLGGTLTGNIFWALRYLKNIR